MQGTVLPLLHFGATRQPSKPVVCAAEGTRIGDTVGRSYGWCSKRIRTPTHDKTSYNLVSCLAHALYFAMLSFLVTGILCIAFPPEATDRYDEHVIPDTAKCLRISGIKLRVRRHCHRHVGKLLNLLLRLDMVKGSNETAMRLFSTRIAESDSVSCNGTLCTDFVLLHTEGPSSPQKQTVVEFEYTNPTTEAMTYGTAVTITWTASLRSSKGTTTFSQRRICAGRLPQPTCTCCRTGRHGQ